MDDNRLDAGHFKGLRALAEAAGARFIRGIVVYCGAAAIPFANHLLALPVTEIWN